MSRTKGYKCFNIKCGSCIGKTLCGEPEDTALVCVDRVIGKPMTNAQKIRSMSDEELAEFLWDFNLADVSTGKMGEFGPHMFRYRLKEWLQQPAEEDDHDERKENENVRR